MKCPVFIRGSDVSSIHTMGSIRGYLQVPHNEKWIQWGSKQEWYELYSVPGTMAELGVFFDRYLKGKINDWEKTPKVRWSALQFGDREAIDDIILEDFPAPSTEYRELFFSKNKQLCASPSLTSHQVSYNSEDRFSVAEFNYTFEKATCLIGLPKAILYISCETQDDYTVFVILRKKDRNGKDLMHLNFPFHATPVKSIDEIPERDQASLNLHLGSVGILRASHREIDSSKSMHPQFPFHPHKRQQKIPRNTVVRLEVGIWAMGVDFDEGESISVRVSSNENPRMS